MFDSEGIPRGVGNQVSAEFNMMYHWHAAISNQDEQWINELSSSIFGPKVDSSMCDASILRVQNNCLSRHIIRRPIPRGAEEIFRKKCTS